MLSPSLRETNTYGGRQYRKKPATVWGTAPFQVRFSGGRNRSQTGAGSMGGPQQIQMAHQFEVFLASSAYWTGASSYQPYSKHHPS